MSCSGSLNDPNGSPAQLGTNNDALKPYVAPDLGIGSWEISSLSPDTCQNGDQRRQEQYVAEVLNIGGAPINIFKLLGVHEQSTNSLLNAATLISSTPYPGYGVSTITSNGWKSISNGSNVISDSCYIGADFGLKKLPNGQIEYAPEKPVLQKVGAITVTQSNLPDEFARQVKVEISDGTSEIISTAFNGIGNGQCIANTNFNSTQCLIRIVTSGSSEFDVFVVTQDGSSTFIGKAVAGQDFYHPVVKLKILNGSIPFNIGDMFVVNMVYKWKRVGIYNLVQSPLPQTINFQTQLRLKAFKITPTLFTNTGNWGVTAIDILEAVPTDINNIQDLFFNENRDRDYSLEPILLKAQYNANDSFSDLSKFGLNILDQYSFSVSFATMVKLLGRPIVVGDIIEVIPEMQYDHNLKPIRKFLEVSDASWAADGYSTMWKPMVYRFSAQQALPSQETKDIFGSLDTQKYLTADSVLDNGIGFQLDTTPLTQTEEIIKEASNAVPEIGSDDGRATDGSPIPRVKVQANPKGQPQAPEYILKPGVYIEDALPKNGEIYGEGYKLPEISTAVDGDYFRLYYPSENKIPPRLYRYSAIKNRWIYQETDRRGDYSSHKPSIQKILQSDTKQGLGKKTT